MKKKEWKEYYLYPKDIPPGNRDWKGMLAKMRKKKRPLPQSIGKILSHREAIDEMERLIVKNLRAGTLARVAVFLSDISPRPWIAGESVMPGILPEDMDKDWYAYNEKTGKIRQLTDDDWYACEIETW